MAQPTASGRGPGDEPARDSRQPSGAPGTPGSGPQAPDGPRDPRLAAFAQGGPGDTCPPDGALAAMAEELSGPDWRCGGATHDELIGLLGRWAALESWTAAGKLGVVRELIRRRARPGLNGRLPMHGDLPGLWEEGLGHEVSAALEISLRAADKLVGLAWDLQARLPGIATALAVGTISLLKAQIVSDELSVLDDEHAAAAEKLVLDQLVGQTPGQLGKLAAQAACAVDPEGAAMRREMAEREQARVRFWRENGGACAMAAYGLPTDAALAANAAVDDRAQAYKNARVRPGATMDQLRVLAFLDILNAVSLQARIAEAAQNEDAEAADRTDADERADSRLTDSEIPAGAPGPGTSDHDATVDHADNGDGPDDDTSSDGSDGGSGDGGGLGGGKPGGPAPGLPALTARANLTIPLTTLLGLADRPGHQPRTRPPRPRPRPGPRRHRRR